MLSRLADGLFWMNRYMERAEALLRAVRTNYILSLEKSPYGLHSWQPVLRIFSDLPSEKILALENNPAECINYLLVQKDNPNALLQLLTKARENARGIQDNITKEVWEQVNQLYRFIYTSGNQKALVGNDPVPTIDKLIAMMLQFIGVADTTTSRDQGWSFMQLGRFTERSLNTIDTLVRHLETIPNESGTNIPQKLDILYWRSLLFSLSGYEHYLKTFRIAEQNSHIIQMLVLNPEFPRSVRYCLSRMEYYLNDIVEKNIPDKKEVLQKQFGKVYAWVLYADEGDITQSGIQNYLLHVKQSITNLYLQVAQQFFSYT